MLVGGTGNGDSCFINLLLSIHLIDVRVRLCLLIQVILFLDYDSLNNILVYAIAIMSYIHWYNISNILSSNLCCYFCVEFSSSSVSLVIGCQFMNNL